MCVQDLAIVKVDLIGIGVYILSALFRLHVELVPTTVKASDCCVYVVVCSRSVKQSFSALFFLPDSTLVTLSIVQGGISEAVKGVFYHSVAYTKPVHPGLFSSFRSGQML